ncbi:MAG: DUF4157 domain-containing protein [Bacteroidota bacterium]
MKQHSDSSGESKQPKPVQEASFSTGSKPLGTPHFADQRPTAAIQRKLIHAANGSRQVGRATQLQAMANRFVEKKGNNQPVQRKSAEASNGLPGDLKAGVENLSGYSMDDVKVHYNSSKPAQLNAHAYAQGTDIHLASGQEKHLPHEAWHVVQQKQGRVQPTKQLKGTVPVNDDAGLEQEADETGAKAMHLGSEPVGSLKKGNVSAPTVQGKWFRMSTILDDNDEQEVMVIKNMAENLNDYTGAFKYLLRHSRNGGQLYSDYIRILYRASKTNQSAELEKWLKNSYFDKYSFTAGQVIGELEKILPPPSPKNLFSGEEIESSENEEFSQDLYTPQELGFMAVEEIQSLANKTGDMDKLAGHFDNLQVKYGMSQIGYVFKGDAVSVGFKINPEFEVKLSGGHAIEMRSAGLGSGAFKTRVQWQPSTLTLATSSKPGGGTYTVGRTMTAHPLSQDHATGTKATADTDHSPMMTKLPAKGNRSKYGSGSGPYFYIRGHLLNDNLGGIANEANLFPITHEANGQHKNYVEQYIKNGVKQGFVYRYEVQIQNVSVGYDTGLNLYTVDSDLAFDFARLNTSLNDVPGSRHKGKIESQYKNKGSAPFDKSVEYASDYTSGSYNNPVGLGTEAVSKTKEQGVSSSNSGLVSNISSGFSYLAPTISSAFGISSGPSQGINSGGTAVPTNQKLSLRNSVQNNVVDYFEDIVTGWKRTDINLWAGAVRSKKLSKWNDVWAEATNNHSLDASIPAQIKSHGFLTRVSINGAAKGT